MPNTKILPNGVMVVADDTHISKWVEQHGTLEIATGFINQYANCIPIGGTVIDVGSCIGDHTATYSKMVGPTGKVVALECGGEAFACLAHNIDQYPNVVAIKAAAGKYPGRGHFIRNENIGASRLEANHIGSVQIISIDALVDFLKIWPNLIKIDAEGWELAILQGAKATMTDMKPAIVLEINQGALDAQGTNKEQIFDLLYDAGYKYVILGNNGKDDPQYDILCTKA